MSMAPNPPSCAIVVRLPAMLPAALVWMIFVGASATPSFGSASDGLLTIQLATNWNSRVLLITQL